MIGEIANGFSIAVIAVGIIAIVVVADILRPH